MGLFEYLQSIIAIVLGLAITKLLQKVAWVFRGFQSTPGHWLVLVWSGLLLITVLGYFWVFWRLFSSVSDMSIWIFIAFPFTQCALFYLVAEFLPVPAIQEGDFDLAGYFVDQRRPFLITLGLFWLHLNVMPHFAPLVGFELNQTLIEMTLGWLILLPLLVGVRSKQWNWQVSACAGYGFIFLSQELIQLAISN